MAATSGDFEECKEGVRGKATVCYYCYFCLLQTAQRCATKCASATEASLNRL